MQRSRGFRSKSRRKMTKVELLSPAGDLERLKMCWLVLILCKLYDIIYI